MLSREQCVSILVKAGVDRVNISEKMIVAIDMAYKLGCNRDTMQISYKDREVKQREST